jgi:hypothetical protein
LTISCLPRACLSHLNRIGAATQLLHGIVSRRPISSRGLKTHAEKRVAQVFRRIFDVLTVADVASRLLNKLGMSIDATTFPIIESAGRMKKAAAQSHDSMSDHALTRLAAEGDMKSFE